MPGGREADHPSLGRILYSGSSENLKEPVKEKAVETNVSKVSEEQKNNGSLNASRHGLFYHEIQKSMDEESKIEPVFNS